MKFKNRQFRFNTVLLTVLIILFTAQNLFASYEEALKLFMDKDYNQSLKKLAELLVVEDDMKPDSPNYKIRFLAAHNHWKLGNLDSATAHFSRCIAIKKESPDPYIDLSLMMLERGKVAEAEKFARRGLTVKKDPMLYFVLGKSSIAVKNYWRAKQFLETANSINPEIFISYHYLGIALLKLKKYSQANTAFSAANAIKPGVPETLNNLAFTYELMGKKKEALKLYRQAAEHDSGNEVIKQNIIRIEKNDSIN